MQQAVPPSADATAQAAAVQSTPSSPAAAGPDVKTESAVKAEL